MEGGLADLLQEDILVSASSGENFHSATSLCPEKMLMLAVLEDAVASIQKYARVPNSQPFREEVDWIMEEKSDCLFSFENICAVLGLNADYIREGLLAWNGKKNLKTRKDHLCVVPASTPKRSPSLATPASSQPRSFPAPVTVLYPHP